MKFIYYYHIVEIGDWAFDSKEKAIESISKKCIIKSIEEYDDDTDLIYVVWEDTDEEEEIFLVKIEVNKE